jgi:TonB family protein
MKALLILIAAALSITASSAQTASTDAASSTASVAKPADPPNCLRWRHYLSTEKMPDKPTLYAFTVKTDGHLADVTVKSSSGNETLDQLGAICMVPRWSYKPGLQDGKPVERPWQAEIIWAQMR